MATEADGGASPPTANTDRSEPSVEHQHQHEHHQERGSRILTRTGKHFKIEYQPPQYDTDNSFLHPAVELHRYHEFHKLRTDIHNQLTRTMGVRLESGRKPTHTIFTNLFAQFVFLQHASRSNFDDPLLPSDPERFDGIIRDFRYLTRPKMNEDEATRAVEALKLPQRCRDFVTEMKRFTRSKLRAESRNDPVYATRRVRNGIAFEVRNRVLFTCTDIVYKKLESRFRKQDTSLSLVDAIFCLFLRYYTLSALSHQWAMVPEMKNYIKGTFKVEIEIFASGINAQYDNYGSLFYDVERLFGSVGSFHRLRFLNGAFVANPPYDESMLQIMVDTMIQVCKDSKQPITFLFGLPAWGKYAPFPPLASADNSGLVVYHEQIPDYKVDWIDYYGDRSKKIPSHHWYIMTNRDAKEFDKESIRASVESHWVERRPFDQSLETDEVKPDRDLKRSRNR